MVDICFDNEATKITREKACNDSKSIKSVLVRFDLS